jgi:hypothetical protein
MAAKSFHTERDGAALAKLRERHDTLLNDPTFPKDLKALRRGHLASSNIAQRQSDAEADNVPGQRAMREAIAGGGDSDDIECARSRFKDKLPNWSQSYGRNRTNP